MFVCLCVYRKYLIVDHVCIRRILEKLFNSVVKIPFSKMYP
jgi:hypothetical protein